MSNNAVTGATCSNVIKCNCIITICNLLSEFSLLLSYKNTPLSCLLIINIIIIMVIDLVAISNGTPRTIKRGLESRRISGSLANFVIFFTFLSTIVIVSALEHPAHEPERGVMNYGFPALRARLK